MPLHLCELLECSCFPYYVQPGPYITANLWIIWRFSAKQRESFLGNEESPGYKDTRICISTRYNVDETEKTEYKPLWLWKTQRTSGPPSFLSSLPFVAQQSTTWGNIGVNAGWNWESGHSRTGLCLSGTDCWRIFLVEAFESALNLWWHKALLNFGTGIGSGHLVSLFPIVCLCIMYNNAYMSGHGTASNTAFKKAKLWILRTFESEETHRQHRDLVCPLGSLLSNWNWNELDWTGLKYASSRVVDFRKEGRPTARWAVLFFLAVGTR